MSDLVKVDPVNHIKTSEIDYHQEFTFSEVHVDEVIESEMGVPDGAELTIVDGGVKYKYEDRVPVIVKEDGCYVEEGSSMRDAEKQCYHVLSVMDSNGFVSGWRKL